MFTKSWGNGEEVIVGLHGWGGDHETFAPLVPWLSGKFTLVACDLPGYGKTPAPARFDRDEIAASIAAWVDSLGHSRVSLLGNCSGALAALLAAPKTKTQIVRLILLDAFAYVPWYFRVFASPAFGDYAYHTTFANPVGRWLTNRGLASRRQAGTDMTGSFSRVNHAATLAWLRMMAEIPGYEYFRPVKAPVELVYGERTFGAVKRSVALWKRLWPEAPVTELRGAGHLGIAEAPRELAGIVFKSDVARVQAKHVLAIS
jgi:pimeloyl-ACP methyl ester carboxylesterase